MLLSYQKYFKKVIMILRFLSSDLRNIYKFRYVISSYVTIHLRMRYRRSLIGFLWTVLAPLINYLIIALVFIYALNQSEADFFTYFFIGSVIFNVLSISLQRAPGIMLVNEMYIKKIYLPKIIYVLNTCAYEFTNFILTSVTLFVVGLIMGKVQISIALLVIPINLILLIFVLIGLCSFLSVSGVFFRDLLYIIPQVMQAFFFLTPIVYKPTVFPEKIQRLIQLNPFYHIIETFRFPILKGVLAPIEHYYYFLFFAITCFLFGYFLIKKYDNRIVFKL